MGLLYTPPDGYQDRPFTWVFDGSTLTDGSNTLNQTAHIYSGYGDFVLRRIMGTQQVLNSSGGQIQFYDSLNRALQDVPMNVGTNNDYGITPELLYPEDTNIRFDLYKVLRSITGGVSSAFLAFGGSNRKKISPQAGGSFKLESRTYNLQTTINQLGGSSILAQKPITLTAQVMDYDFDLYELKLGYSSAGGAVPFPATALWVYDSTRQYISNLPVLDIFCTASPSTLRNGALVPPLPFPVWTRLQVDFYSVINNAALLPVTINLSLIGMRRVPCQ